MKKYIIIVMSLIGVMSCDSDFLDKKPLDAITEEDVFNDDVLLTAYVTACYNAIPNGFDEAMMSSTTDETYSRHGSSSSVLVSRGEMNPDNITTFDSNRFANFNYWSKAYEQLRNINTFFEKIDAATISDDVKKRLTGEMKFIRAFVYANLIWRFSGVPLITKTYALTDTDYSIQRNSYDECVDFIVKELDEAIGYLPAVQSGSNYGKASANACKALKSRVLLYAASPINNPGNDRGKWEKASTAALEVIQLPDHHLYNDYRKIFLVNNNEVIFQRQFTKANGTMMNVFNSPNGYGGWGGNCPLQNLVDDYEIKATGKRPFEEGSGYDPANPYAGRDPRFDATILYNGAMFRGRPVETFIPGGLDTNEGPVGSW
ncbi:MAG: RagB/SusD family nutrient uptake outer membrane protein, partial [Tannerella sp.]|nr:RagB/SusD family nutrient uptake outer membrane protein [Tannerella sp.]